MYKNFRSSDMTVTELAEQASYSEPHFRELFLRAFGISPKKYIINLRLEYAGQLLSSQLYSVQETAALSGFENPKYFSAAFHRKYGVSPREYSRKKAKKGPEEVPQDPFGDYRMMPVGLPSKSSISTPWKFSSAQTFLQRSSMPSS